MTPQELKNSILQLAIQGKLVEQRPEEGTAEELYRQMQAQKKQLIKNGLIKKTKNLPAITEDEFPFEIPKSWKWMRLAEIWTVINGDRGKNYPAKSTLSNKGIPFISALNLSKNTVVEDDNLLCLSETQYKNLRNGKLQKDDVVVCIRGSLGKHGVYPFEKGAIASSLVILRNYYEDIALTEFLTVYLDSPLFFSEIRKYDNGTAQPNLSAKSLELFLIPVPPIAEQKRIAVKIEKSLPYMDHYEQAWNRLEDFNKRFPDEMKKSILQMAIQGKLVEQRPEEGTAEELYRQIQTEKQQLIRTGKIKKEKPLPEIAEDEKPFEIPESWKWVRVGNIGTWAAGATPSRTLADYYGGSIPWLKTGDLNDGYVSDIPEYITKLALEKTSVRLNPVGSVLMAMYGATIGKLGILQVEATTNQACCACIPYDGMWNEYLFYFLMANRQTFIKMGEGGAQPNISKEKIVNALISLPPLAEQKRIVARLKELLPLCERLK